MSLFSSLSSTQKERLIFRVVDIFSRHTDAMSTFAEAANKAADALTKLAEASASKTPEVPESAP